MPAKKEDQSGDPGRRKKKLPTPAQGVSSAPARAQSAPFPAGSAGAPVDNALPEAIDNPAARSARLFPVVGIGASAGGLEAFTKFLKAMPSACGMALVLIPHLDPNHESLMVELLARQTPLPVSEATDGQSIEINHIYIIPPNKYLAIRGGHLYLVNPPDSRLRQTALDYFFRTLAEDARERAIGVVLSGTGSHGTLGLKEIKLMGGMAMVQDPVTAGFDQMPASAIATGLVDYILPPEKMPEALIRYVRHPSLTPQADAIPAEAESGELLNRILILLRIRTRYDFRCYRKNMLLRRVNRRMRLLQLETLEQYVDTLRDTPEEVLALYKDLLIGVTSFFRDAGAFQTLEQLVIPELVNRKEGEPPVRVWVPSCATGEEAYTIAILLMDRFSETKIAPNMQIFASDIDEEALRVARAGVYPETITADVSPERLRRYFTKNDAGSYQVNKGLREAIVFAPQNLIGDAPFSKLDLISCRNLLIYLEPEVQKKVVAIFHFALNADGYLMLGPSETVGRHEHLFEPLSSRWRIYRRTGPKRGGVVEIPLAAGRNWRLPVAADEPIPRSSVGFTELMQRELLAAYAPASVLINRNFEVLSFHGPTVNYLEFPSGEPTSDLLTLARKGLRTRLRTLLSDAIRGGAAATDANTRVLREDVYIPCRITVKPLIDAREGADLFLVVFEERHEAGGAIEPAAETTESPHDIALVTQLEDELKATREDLQAMIEELESSNEEMKASNEEMMSMNEEMQSINEELETSKEELQSTNEELNTVNSQLSLKVKELKSTNNDINNLIDSTDIPTIFLTTDLRIRRFTPSITSLFSLREADAGRPIEDIVRKFSGDELDADCRAVLSSSAKIARELQAHNGHHYLRQMAPYRTVDQAIDGVVITFIDITERKRAAEIVLNARRYFEGIVAAVREPLVVVDQSLAVRSANPSFLSFFEVTPDEIEGRPLYELIDHALVNPRLRSLLAEVATTGREIADFEVTWTAASRGERTMLLNARAIPNLGDQPPLILVAMEDITERKEAELALMNLNLTLEERVASRTIEAERRTQELIESERELRSQQQLLQAILRSVRDGVIVADMTGRLVVFNPAAVAIVGLGPADLPPEDWQAHYGLFMSDQVTPCSMSADPLYRAMHGEEVVDLELFVRNASRPDGLWLSANSCPLLDHKGAVMGGVNVLRDITLSKRSSDALRDREERLRAIVTTAADAIVTIDDQGKIESCNPAAERMFAYPPGQLIGRSITSVIPSSYLERRDHPLSRYVTTVERPIGTMDRELIGRRFDGSSFPIDLAVSEFHVGSRRLFTGIIRDITERKALQQELLSIAEDEQRRIGQDLHDDIGQELTGLALKAETLHEIVGEGQIPDVQFTAEIVAGIDRARAKIRTLSRGLVPLDLDSKALAPAIKDLVERLGHLSGVQCVFTRRGRQRDIEARVATQLYHIAQEAIANAIKHGQAGKIKVSLEFDASTVKLCVEDNGVGISDDRLRSGGMGLRIMSYRAGLFDGKLKVTGGNSGGTLVTCLAPLEQDDHGSSRPEGRPDEPRGGLESADR